MDGFQWDAVLLRGLFHSGHPVVSKGALIGIVEDKAVALRFRMSGTVLEFRRFGVRLKRQSHQCDAAVRRIRDIKALVRHILRVRQKFPLPALCGKDTKPLFALRLRVPDALREQIIGIAVPFHGAGDPQAVDIEIPVRFDRHPCVFRRYVFDEALAAFLTAVKNKPLVKPLLEPFLFYKALLAGHGTADMLLVDVLSCDPDIIHFEAPNSLSLSVNFPEKRK